MSIRSTAVGLLFFAVAGSASADPRQAFGVERAQAVEAVVAHIYPGAHVEWAPALALVRNDGTRELLQISDMALRAEPAGFTVLIPLEFPDTDATLEAQMGRFEVPAGRTKNELVAAKLSSAFAVTEIRRGSIPDSATTTEIVSVNFVVFPLNAAWPDANLEYAARYSTTEWAGQVLWTARVTTSPIALVSHVPAHVARSDKDGTSRDDVAEIQVVDAQTLAIDSATGGQRITTCPAACHIDGKVLLGLWWTTRTVVATP